MKSFFHIHTLLITALTIYLTQFAVANPPKAQMNENHRSFFKNNCNQCHNAEKQKGKVRLDNIAFTVDTVENADLWQKVLNAINSGDMPPEDEKQPNPSVKADFLDDLSRTLVTARSVLSDSGGMITMRRLNRREYKNTLRDLLGVEVDVSMLPADSGAGTFDTVGSSLFMSSDQFEQYLELGSQALDEHFARSIKQTNEQQNSRITKTLKQRREVEQHANTVAGGTYNGYFKGGYESSKKFLETGKPQQDIHDEQKAKFRIEQFEKIGPSYERYLNDPLTKNGSYLTIYKVNHEEFITLPPDQPSNWLKTKHVVEKVEPGDYLLRFRIATVKGSPKERHFVDLGSRVAGEEDFTLIDTFQISGTTESPQIIEVPVSITMNGPRTFVLREKRDVKLDHEVFHEEVRKTKLGPPPVLWIDWVEWEGPLQTSNSSANITPAIVAGQTNARVALESFAKRAFRGKQPSATFLDKLTALHDARIKAGDSFDKAIREPLSVILASPSFLYLQESGIGLSPVQETETTHKPIRLSHTALASRLSYFLWSAPPDAQLLAADLTKPEVLAREVDRMITSKKSDEFVSGFVHQWLGMHRLDFFQFDTKQFPNFDESTKAAARREVYETFAYLLRHNGSLTKLIKSDEVHINGLLAIYYEIEGVSGNDFRKVKLPANSPRGGLLGMAAILAMGSNGQRTSPVERGVWVMKHLLNNPPPPAPPNVPQLDRLAGKPISPRERLLAHQEQAQCAQCHRKIDPIGFGLENFDAVGKWRTEDIYVQRGKPTQKWLIDPAGAFYKGPAFKDYFQLRDLIAAKPDPFAHDFTEALIEYSLGRPYGFSDKLLAESIVKRSQGNNFTLSSFIQALVASQQFQSK